MNKFFKIIGIVFLGLAILIGVPGYLFVKNFDLNRYKSTISEIVETQLGRKFSINGEASIGISLVPTLILEDVQLANAPWASHPQMVTVQKLELKFALIPLFKKQIVVDKAVLINPEVYLEIYKSGEPNWDFPAFRKIPTATVYESSGFIIKSALAQEILAVDDAPKTTNLEAFAGFAAKSVVIENGIVQYNNQQDNSKVDLQIKKLSLAVPDIDDPINADFDVVYNGQNINAKTTMGSLNDLMETTKPYPVILNGSAYGLNVDLNGSVVDLFNQMSYAAEANIYNPAGNLDAPEITLKARVDGNLKQVAVNISLLNIVENVITGKVKVNFAGKIPVINADFKSNKINLLTLQSNRPTAFNMSDLLMNTAQATSLVPATVVPYADLKGINANANITIGTLIIDEGMTAKDVLATANLNNGILNVSPLRLKFGGGEIDAQLKVNANTQSVGIKAVSKNILLQNLHKEFLVTGPGDFGVLNGGKTDIYVDLIMNGGTYRQLVDSSQGQMVAVLNQSIVQTGKLDFMSGNFITEVLNTINFSSKKARDLDLRCAVVRADLGSGRATFPKGIAISSPQLSLVSNGYINLENDKLDFSIHPFSGKVVDTNVAQALSSFFKVKGTISNPKIVLDDKEALAAFVGVVTTGGTAYLGSKLVLEADSSPCYTALLNTPYQKMFPKPTGVTAATQDVYQDTTKTIKTDFRALKNGAKDFLRSLKNQEKDF